MKYAIIFVVISMTTGCGANKSDTSLKDNNHGFGWHFDAQAANGIKLRNEPTVVDPVAIAVLADIYDETRACTGLSAPGPFVIVVVGSVDGPDGEAVGRTYYQPPLILISENPSWTGIARHEFVHYLLYQNSFPRESNSAHDSTFFIDCVY